MDYQDSGNRSCPFHIGNRNGDSHRSKKMWNEISQMFLLGSLSGIAVLGDTISEYLSVNLLMIFLIINAGVVLLRIAIRENEYI